ncbi:MAG: DMT family transporter [Hylemonella sp.]|nr:DMT family transporter [Hylemonella sp.]MDH5708540.1 DMT family transporter [Hylemonella sp.]
MKSALAPWALVFNALVFGLSWWPFRAMQQHGLHPLWATAFIYLLALAGLLAWRPRMVRSLGRPGPLWLLLLAAGLTNVCFNWAVTIGDVLRVVLLFYLMPAWAALLAWPLLGERPRPAALLRLALALGGVALVLKTGDSPWPLPVNLADWLALAGGLCFALTNVLLRKLQDSPEEARMQAMFGGGALMALVAAAIGLQTGLVESIPAPAAGWLLPALATCAAFLAANLALQYGAARLPSSTTSLILLTELVFASLSSVLLGVAVLDSATVAGGALILLAALWAAWPAPRR